MQGWKFFVVLMLGLGALAACHNDDSNKPVVPSEGPGQVRLAVTSRIGTYVGQELTDYVKSLHILLFRQNDNGTYLLTENAFYNKEQLLALTNGTMDVASGFTETKDIDFENLPIGTYMIAGVGNMADSLGTALEYADLSGIAVGNTMEEVIASIASGHASPRIFFGLTEPFLLGSALPANPALRLFRKVAMFGLTIEKVPVVVKRIDIEIENTEGAFNMTGNYLPGRVIPVSQSRNYSFTEEQASLPVPVITLPTVTGQTSAVTLIFYLENGQVITIPLQNSYVLKENTITQLTATINADQEGGQWSVDLTISISADVEWNVDQEPGIII